MVSREESSWKKKVSTNSFEVRNIRKSPYKLRQPKPVKSVQFLTGVHIEVRTHQSLYIVEVIKSKSIHSSFQSVRLLRIQNLEICSIRTENTDSLSDLFNKFFHPLF